jgi:acyl-[acyl-carrier-protein] desaturase
MERGRMEQVCRGYYPDGDGGAFTDPIDGLVYTTLQELATRISHRNTGRYTEDPLIERLTARVAVDENLHYVFYRELTKAALALDPSAVVLAIHRQVTGFAMPGLGIPEFRRKALQMAKAGIYDLRIHHDQVLAPVLLTHWKLGELTGLSDDAERARSETIAYMAAVDAAASRFEEKRSALAVS